MVIDEAICTHATTLGRMAGSSRGSWVLDGNSSDELCHKLIQGYEDGDPEVLDMCPSPLSGEWADDWTPAVLCKELGVDENDDAATEFMDAFESAFQESFWEVVIASAKARVE